MFEELFEYDWVIGLLTECASCPRGTDITDLTGNRSELIRRVNVLIDAITEKERKTMAVPAGRYKKRNLAIGFSEESRLLCQLWNDLINAGTPAKLKAALPDMKLALLKAMVIGRDLKHEGLEFKYLEILPAAAIGKKISDGGKKGRERAYGTADKKEAIRKTWQEWVDKKAVDHADWSYTEIRRQVAKENNGEVSEHQLKRYTTNPKKK